MADQNNSTSGTISFDKVGVPPSPPPDPVAGQAQETVVVPTGGSPGAQSTPGGSPFVIPGNETPVSPGVQETRPPKSGGSVLGGIFRFLFILIVLGALGFAGYYFWSRAKTNQSVTLTYWGLWENPAIVQPVLDAFHAENPAITVEYVRQSHKEYRERLVNAIDRGEGPDIFRFHNTWLYMLRNQIEPAPLEIYSGSEFAAAFYPVAANDLVAGTTVYGVPLMIDGLGLYINEDLFSAAGASPPVTWDDVAALVPRLTAPPLEVRENEEITTSAIALGTTNNIEHVSDIMALLFMQNGAQMSNLDGTAAEGAFIFFRKFSDPRDELYTWNSTFDNSILAFANSRVAMMLAPSWRAFDVKTINPDLRFRIVPVPQLPGNTVNWASYWVEGVSNKAQNTEAAWKFVKFLTTRESAEKIYAEAANTRLFGEPYARKEMAALVSGDPYVSAYVAQAETARSFPVASRTWDNGLNDQMIDYLVKGINITEQGGSPEEAVTLVKTGFTEVLSRYGLISAQPVSP